MRSLLHYAAERMRFRAVKMMIEEFNFDPNLQDISGNTPLHLACLAQKVQNVMYLLSTPSCDPNILNMVGDTPLHMCATIGVDVVTKYLFNCRRVDKNLKNAKGKTGVELMDERCSALVKGCNRESGAMSPRSENGLSEEGMTRSKSLKAQRYKIMSDIFCELNNFTSY